MKTATGKHFDGWAFKAIKNSSKYGLKKGECYGSVFRKEKDIREWKLSYWKDQPNDLIVRVCDCLREVK